MADLSDIDLTLRSEVAVPLTAVQHDANLTDIEDAINAINAKLNLLDNNVATYGEMQGDGTPTAVTCAVDGTYYTVTDFEAGHLDNVTFGTNSLVLPTAGDYYVSASLTVTGVAAHVYRFTFALDGVEDMDHIGEIQMDTPGTDEQTVPLVGIVTATAGQALTLSVADIGGTGDVTIQRATVVAQKKH